MNSIYTSTDKQKLMAAALPACFITFLLFALMQQLVKTEQNFVQPELFTLDDTLPEPRKDSQANTKIRILPEPPKPLPQPESLAPEANNSSEALIGLEINPLLPPLEAIQGAEVTALDKEATAMVRIDPNYPPDAARNGVEGWVKLKFSIDVTGAVIDVEVLDAQPKRIFDREAIKALRSWKYQPQLKNGKAVVQPDMQVQLDFSLDKT